MDSEETQGVSGSPGAKMVPSLTSQPEVLKTTPNLAKFTEVPVALVEKKGCCHHGAVSQVLNVRKENSQAS